VRSAGLDRGREGIMLHGGARWSRTRTGPRHPTSTRCGPQCRDWRTMTRLPDTTASWPAFGTDTCVRPHRGTCWGRTHMPIDLDPTVVRSWPRLRAYWRHVRGVCARCARPIDYDGPRYRYGVVRGVRVRRENPWALDVGHIVESDRDLRCMWAPVDTQPEHVLCNRRAGARYGNRKRGRLRRLRAAGAVLRTSRSW
jgi:hypothetical protein